MNEEKIINLKDEDLPIDCELLWRKLQEIPDDIKSEYAQALTVNIDELLLWKNVFNENSTLTKHLIMNLSPSQLERFNKIVLNLVFIDSKKSISKILEATLDFESPTPESQEKAAALINLIKSHNIDYDAFFREFAFSARQLFHIATVILTVGMGKAFEDQLFGHLSKLPATEFDGISELFEEKLKCKVVE